jgi:hypothetical protein
MPSKESGNLDFDQYAIRWLIGALAFALPWAVSLWARQIPSSISWSYHTAARDIFVGALFVIGAFLISYKGHHQTVHQKDLGKFWHWLNQYWKGALRFRVHERKHEEDWVSTLGGIAAIVTALNPTAYCTNSCPCEPIPAWVTVSCASDLASQIHLVGAFILFTTTAYFCLVAFRIRAEQKINQEQGLIRGWDPATLRLRTYLICGCGIVIVMATMGLFWIAQIKTASIFTFLAETIALELFGFAWLVASNYLMVFTGEKERKILFSDSRNREKV